MGIIGLCPPGEELDLGVSHSLIHSLKNPTCFSRGSVNKSQNF
jgi:hypothetical protein